MGKAFLFSERLRASEQASLLAMRNKIWQQLSAISGVTLNGDWSARIAGNLNFSIQGIDGEQLLPALHGLTLSSMSACALDSSQPSYVLRAIGLDTDLAKSSIRLSLGRFTTEEDVDKTISILTQTINELR